MQAIFTQALRITRQRPWASFALAIVGAMLFTPGQLVDRSVIVPEL